MPTSQLSGTQITEAQATDEQRQHAAMMQAQFTQGLYMTFTVCARNSGARSARHSDSLRALGSARSP